MLVSRAVLLPVGVHLNAQLYRCLQLRPSLVSAAQASLLRPCFLPPPFLPKMEVRVSVLFLLIVGFIQQTSESHSKFVGEFGVTDTKNEPLSLSRAAAEDRFPKEVHPLYASQLGYMAAFQSFWRGQSNDHKSLIDKLRQEGVIKSEKVREAMEKIDRGLFVPEGAFPYMDSPIPIGYNATISAPHMHALCLELLQDHLKPGMRALDVGSGTGYLTACFAHMLGEQGRAVGVEHIPELVEQSIENVRVSEAVPLLEAGSLSLHVGDGRIGWKADAPYDAIHVGAAVLQVPEPLLHQLKPGGRMVIPVGDYFQGLQIIDKQPDGSISKWTETSVRYVPLTSRTEQLGL